MGKRKYNNVRSANSSKNVPNFVPYKKLAKHISNVDIENVQNIDPIFTYQVPTEEVGKGCYRDLIQFCPRLAQFYLHLHENRVDKLKTFPDIERKSPNSSVFLVAIGGDEAPGSGTKFLISFLNIGCRIASSQENFLTFGANVNESGLVVRNYVKKLVSELQYLEQNIFQVNVNNQLINVDFKVESIPNDMKMVAFLAGELTNSSINVKSKGTSTWTPFNYEKRVADAQKVFEKKQELEKKKIKPQTYRNHVTSYVKSLHSRQEEEPLIGRFVDKAK